MVTTLFNLQVMMKKLNYAKSNLGGTYNEIYWAVEHRGSDSNVKIIICADMGRINVFTNEGVERMKEYAVSQFENVPKENVLLVGIISKKRHDITARNTILLDPFAEKCVINNVSPLFEPELSYIKEEKKDRIRQEKHLDALTANAVHEHSAYVIYILMAILLMIYASITTTKNELFGISAEAVFKNGESYRLITYLFVHGGISHVFGNCVSLFVIGRLYAKRKNALDVLVVYLGSGIISGTVSIFWSMVATNTPEVMTVGASGAIFAQLGAFMANILCDSATIGRRKPYVKYAAFVIILNLLGGANVDLVCHIAGFVSGAFLEVILCKADSIWAKTRFIETRDKKLTSF